MLHYITNTFMCTCTHARARVYITPKYIYISSIVSKYFVQTLNVFQKNIMCK